MLPKMNGILVLKKIRKISKTPVLMLTALSDEGTQLASFDNLADDYLCKPFSLLILEKRIGALLRRTKAKEEKTITEDDLRGIEKNIDSQIKDFPAKIDEMFKSKEAEIMKV